MEKKTPKSIMVKAFLLAKGWEFQEKNDKYYKFNPPKGLVFNPPLQFNVPIWETALDYREYILQIVGSIAEIYELNKSDLVNDLSKSITEIQKEIDIKTNEIAFRKQLLAFA